jgi:hypothetical protein
LYTLVAKQRVGRVFPPALIVCAGSDPSRALQAHYVLVVYNVSWLLNGVANRANRTLSSALSILG